MRSKSNNFSQISIIRARIYLYFKFFPFVFLLKFFLRFGTVSGKHRPMQNKIFLKVAQIVDFPTCSHRFHIWWKFLPSPRPAGCKNRRQKFDSEMGINCACAEAQTMEHLMVCRFGRDSVVEHRWWHNELQHLKANPDILLVQH